MAGSFRGAPGSLCEMSGANHEINDGFRGRAGAFRGTNGGNPGTTGAFRELNGSASERQDFRRARFGVIDGAGGSSLPSHDLAGIQPQAGAEPLLVHLVRMA